MTFAPQLVKNWNLQPNVRNAFVSLADMTGWCLYENKAEMVLRGWTVKFSSDGTTGPTNAADTTDRWLAKANASVRGASASVAQSWIVLQNSDGLQVLLTFQGATDDVARISYSPKGLYTLAGTTTFQPTATDEVIETIAANSLVNASTSLDRVMTIWTTTDTRHWFFAIFRNGSLLNIIGTETVTNLCSPVGTFGDGVSDIPYIGYRYTTTTRDPAQVGGAPLSPWAAIAAGATGCSGAVCRVFTTAASRINRIAGRAAVSAMDDGISFINNVHYTPLTNTPPLQGGSTWVLRLLDFIGEKTANLEGWLGFAIDWWVAEFTTSFTTPSSGDFSPGYDPGDTPGVTAVRTNWLVALGPTFIRPWRNAAVSLEMI